MEYFPSEKRLLELADKQVRFLRKCHFAFVEILNERTLTLEGEECFETLEDPKFSIYRYLELWLPLVLKHSQEKPVEKLVPPLDIAWLWHVHRLMPTSYLECCKKIASRNLEDHIKAENILEAGDEYAELLETLLEGDDISDYSVRLWEKTYPDVGFFQFKRDEKKMNLKMERYGNNNLATKILNSSKTHRGFLYQVSRPLFQQFEMLRIAYDDYLKFILLIAENKLEFNVPRYDIDLMWHSYMTGPPLSYYKSCREIIGAHLSHDDSITDRSADSKLVKSFKQTGSNWRQKYGEPPVKYYYTKKSDFENKTLSRRNIFEPQIISVNIVETDEQPKKRERSYTDVRIQKLGLKPGGEYFTIKEASCCLGRTEYEYYQEPGGNEAKKVRLRENTLASGYVRSVDPNLYIGALCGTLADPGGALDGCEGDCAGCGGGCGG
eukprot:snap_masked-scaffold_13-processed-gene-0.22-mRNA-1 protein AED:1.00 eAED:1.00 QI:0/0/0/0/1/1/2/0/437